MNTSHGAMIRPGNGRAETFLADRVTQLYHCMPLALSAILINATILSVVLWTTAGRYNVSVWFGLTLVITLLRFALYYAFRRRKSVADQSASWMNLFLLGVFCSGAAWGSTAYFLFPAHDTVYQLFVMFIVAGMAAGSVTTLSASFRANLYFLIPAISPLILLLFLLDEPLSGTMGGMLLLFLVMISLAAWQSSRMISESLRRHYGRERAEAVVEFQASYDSLTGLPNRRLLVDRLDQEISRCRRHNHMAAVLFIDIDRFKTINDSLGHEIGDALLREIARRLRDNVRAEDTAARPGSDEFVLVLSSLGRDPTLAARKAQHLAEKIGTLLSQPYETGGHILHSTPSIGIALCPVEGADAEEILKQSDIAMYRAKELGRNTTQFYRPDMQRAAKDRMAMENDLREALQRNEMELYFQPQLDADGRNVAAEALLRWHHTERGMVSPAEFIPVAEDTGIILELGEWVLITACAQLKSWMELADRGVIKQFPTISVNVSPRQFRQQNFLQRVQQVIEQSNVDPRCVELELTESMLIDDIEDTAHKMEQLARLGVRLAIDDFGTGYSSLHYLKKLQLHRIKIDQSFVRNVHTDAGSAVIVKTIILMAHNLGLEVIAEGVETEAELRFLRENGCLNYQGYYFSKPLPGDMFLRYLQTGN